MLTARATTVLRDIDGTLVHSGGVAALRRLVAGRLAELRAQTGVYPGADALLAKQAFTGCFSHLFLLSFLR